MTIKTVKTSLFALFALIGITALNRATISVELNSTAHTLSYIQSPLIEQKTIISSLPRKRLSKAKKITTSQRPRSVLPSTHS